MDSFLSPQTISANHPIQREKEKKKELEKAEKHIKQQIKLVLNFYDQEEEFKPNRKLLILDWDKSSLSEYYYMLREKLIKDLQEVGWKVFETTMLLYQNLYDYGSITVFQRWYFFPQDVEFNGEIIDNLKNLPFNTRDYFVAHRSGRGTLSETNYMAGENYETYHINSEAGKILMQRFAENKKKEQQEEKKEN